MDKLKLIHNRDKFVLELNDTPINFVSAYEIKSSADRGSELKLSISIDMDKSSIDIDNETKLV